MALGENILSQRQYAISFEDVFNIPNMTASVKDCYKGVNWKTSTINYKSTETQNVAVLLRELLNGSYKSKPFVKSVKTERGKSRNISALHIRDRHVQKCYCNYFLVPLLTKRLIYDNGACMKGKGCTFAVNRLKAHLQQYYRKNNFSNSGYVLTFDFSKFFESINHKLLLERVGKVVEKENADHRLFEMYGYFVNAFEGDKGLGLGSQISQISALFFATEIDHYIKERAKMKYYARYMDDGYVISNSKEELQTLKKQIISLADEIGLKVNVKKTRIWNLQKGFMLLNRHWYLKNTGYVKLKPSHTTLLRMRKRYRKIIVMRNKDAVDRFVGSTNGFIKQFKNGRLKSYVYN